MCRSKTQRKNTSLTRHLTPWHSPQTPTAPQRQTTRGKTPEPKNSSTMNLKVGQEVPKRLISSPLAHFFFFDRAADGRKHRAQMRELEISKKKHFCEVHFSFGKKRFSVKPHLKQHAFRSIGCFIRCLYTPTLMFSDSKRRSVLKPRKGLEIWLPHRNFDTPDLLKGPIPTEKGAKRGSHSEFLRDERGPGQAGHLVVK